MDKIISAIMFITVGIVFIIFVNKGATSAIRVNSRPLVFKIANVKIDIVRALTIILGIAAIVVGVIMLLGIIELI